MPIYEYRCPHCGHQFETMHAVNAAPPKCERCGRAVRRVFTPVGIIFKGSGWHITDYRKTPVPTEGDGKKSDSAASGKSEKKSGDGAAAGSAPSGANSDTGKKSGSKSASRSGGGGAS